MHWANSEHFTTTLVSLSFEQKIRPSHAGKKTKRGLRRGISTHFLKCRDTIFCLKRTTTWRVERPQRRSESARFALAYSSVRRRLHTCKIVAEDNTKNQFRIHIPTPMGMSCSGQPCRLWQLCQWLTLLLNLMVRVFSQSVFSLLVRFNLGFLH